MIYIHNYMYIYISCHIYTYNCVYILCHIYTYIDDKYFSEYHSNNNIV